jgi:hypothetical protein
MSDNKKLPHLFLKNEATNFEKFKKTRGWDAKPKEEEAEKNYAPQKDSLRNDFGVFNREMKARHRKRSLDVPEHIDQIKIFFFPVFDNKLQKEFIKKYGLQVLSYYDFNKTVLFAIDNVDLFKSFQTHLKQYYESPSTSAHNNTEYSHISLIYHFEFITSQKIIKGFDEQISSINLISTYGLKPNKIFKNLIQYLSERQLVYAHYSDSNTIEIKGLKKPQIELIVDNFDIIQSVQSIRAGKIRPGRLGNVIRSYGLTIKPNKKAPYVGVIDTGVQPIEPLRPIIANFNFDLTNTLANWDTHGHGTMVAGLVALGEEYFKDFKQEYYGKAFIVPIKVLTDSEGHFSQNELIDVIEKAYKKGVRLFNLSVNHWSKAYNSAFSNYAYLLDSLNYKYDLLIFISTGNIDSDNIEALQNTPHRSHKYPNYFYCLNTSSSIHECESTNICIPAESLNNMSIGALAENYVDDDRSGITPSKLFPASYTRKFHYDYTQKINGTNFQKNQKNQNLIKPDLIFAGGDLLDQNAGMEVLSIQSGQFYTQDAGTSFSSPLVTSIAAEILTSYPTLKTQTVKALLINSANSVCGNNPPSFAKGLLRKLIGNGTPNRERVLYSNDNSITFVIEDYITAEEFKIIKIKLPEYLNPTKNESNHRLNITATLCYKFPPVKDNHLSYCPLHISFGVFKPDIQGMANKDAKEYKIKNSVSWSEDFHGIENRLLSNVQKIDYNLQPSDIGDNNNEISIAIRCTNKEDIDATIAKALKKNQHEFSIVLTFTELPHKKSNTNRLYNELSALNEIEAIGTLESDIEIDLDE